MSILRSTDAFRRTAAGVIALLLLLLASAAAGTGLLSAKRPESVTLSFIGTADLHGVVFERDGRGGLAALGGYVKALRAARQADGGAVLLLDAGDTFQGAMESNLTEGALVIDAYNALRYTAAAIGNHEFDFGAAEADGPDRAYGGDPRGAIKARAAQARFPFLAANLIDERTNRPVVWPNVTPSTIVSAAGVRVGLVGVMTINAMRATLAANTRGLRVAPLAPAIASEAAALRRGGAQVVVAVAHAGGRCTRFDDPDDLSSCDPNAEIFQVARELPAGLVDVIVAGHAHAGLAHRVNGIVIVEAYSHGRAFARADVSVNRVTGAVERATPFAPRDLCLFAEAPTGGCAGAGADAAALTPARYEGRTVSPDEQVTDAMAPALARVRSLREVPIGVVLETPLQRSGDLESPLGNLFADALRESVPGADVAINNNATGGLRADLPPGPLTFGALYDVFPFDNRVVRLQLTASDLGQVFVEEIRRRRRGALGVSGIQVKAGCAGDQLRVDLLRPSGSPIPSWQRLLVVTTDFLAGGTVFAPVAARAEGSEEIDRAPLAREVVATWLRRRGGRLRDELFVGLGPRRWEFHPSGLQRCA